MEDRMRKLILKEIRRRLKSHKVKSFNKWEKDLGSFNLATDTQLMNMLILLVRTEPFRK